MVLSGLIGLIANIVGTIVVILDGWVNQTEVRSFNVYVEEVATSLLGLSVGQHGVDLEVGGLGLLVSWFQSRTLGIGQHRAGHALVFDDVNVVRSRSDVFSQESNANNVGTRVNRSVANGVGTVAVIVLVNSTKRLTIGVGDLGNERLSSLSNGLAKFVSGLNGEVSGDVGLSTFNTRTVDQALLRIST